MSQPRRYYGENHLHFLTTSTYRRARIFDSEHFRSRWVATLAELRTELGFRIVGYVLMPEHFHLLLWPCGTANPSQIMQKLKGRTARLILKALRENRRRAWCAKMLGRFTLPASVHDEAHCRVWQRRFYDMNVWSPKKLNEKLHYMHNNPVKRGLAAEPGDWACLPAAGGVELEVLLSPRRFPHRNGSNAMSRREPSRCARSQTLQSKCLRHPPNHPPHPCAKRKDAAPANRPPGLCSNGANVIILASMRERTAKRGPPA